MSLTYEVAVPQGKWPSFAAMNAALAARDYPLAVLCQGDQKPDDPMAEFDGFLSFHVRFMGELQEMEVYCGQFGPEGQDSEDINELLEEIGSDRRVKDGEHYMNASFGPRIPQEYFAPYCFLMGTLCLDFDGYGYEGQGPSHGGRGWAQDLIDTALGIVEDERRKAAEGKEKAQAAADAKAEEDANILAAQSAELAEAKKKKGFPLWRTLAVIIVMLLVAEFVDKNIYNFTGAGGSQDAPASPNISEPERP